ALGILLLVAADAQHHPRGDGGEGILPVRANLRGGRVRGADRQRRVGGARQLLRARPRAADRPHDRGCDRRPAPRRRPAAADRRGRAGPGAGRAHRRAPRGAAGRLPDARGRSMIEAVMIWNEPNNLSHWDFELDPEWAIYGAMASAASEAVAAEAPGLTRVLGGISPIDPRFIERMDRQGVLDKVDVVAVHGFPLDWNHWQIHEWPDKLAEIRAVTRKPVWVSEVGVSTFGAEEVQEFGLIRTAELLRGAVDH